MNVKKTALATAIALTMAGGGPAWAETSTVEGQFIADKLVVGGGDSVNLALLGLNANGEVDRFGESEGATIMAVVESDKGIILGGSITPNAPGPKGGFFTSDVKYIELTQGVGRISIYYPEEIVDREETKDTVTVYLQERVSTGEGGVKFTQIGHAVDKTITILPGVGIIPERIKLDSFKAPDGAPEGGSEQRANGIGAFMTAGYEGAEITVVDPDFAGKLRSKTSRAGSTVRLDLLYQNGDSLHTDTEKLLRGEATFILPAFTEAHLYNVVATVVEDETVNTTTEDADGNVIFTDTLEVLPRREVRGLKLSVSKEQIALLNKDNADLASECASQMFPFDQLCQGTWLSLKVLDEFGNETTKTTSGLLEVDVNDSNKIVKNGAVKFWVDPGMGQGRPDEPTDPEKDAVLGNHPSETLAAGTASIVAQVVDNVNEIVSSTALEVKVLQNSLVAKPVEPHMVQTAGDDFDAFFVGLLNRNGDVIMKGDRSPLPYDQADTPENRPFTSDPGLVVIESPRGEINESFRSVETNIVQANFKKVTPPAIYMLHDKAGKYAPVQTMAWAIKAAAANKVVKVHGSGDADNPLKAEYVKVNNQFQLTLPEDDFQLWDIHDNVVDVYGNAGTPDVGTFTLRGTDGGTVNYPNQATEPFGRPYPAGTGNITVTYGVGAAEATRHLQATFTKPGLEEKVLTLTVEIPKVPGDVDDPDEPAPDVRGPIVTYLEGTNEIDGINQVSIPVNSEVALRLETLTEEGGDIIKGHSVRFLLNGLDEDTVTPSVSELVWSDIKTRSEPITAVLTEEKCEDENGLVVGDECRFPLTEIECNSQGYIFTIQGHCREQTEDSVAQGERLDLLKAAGQEVLVVKAGSKEGQFSLHFSYTDTKEIEQSLVFKVTREIVVEPPVTEEECKTNADYWAEEDGVCKALPNIGNPIPGKSTSGLLKPNGNITFTSKAQFKGGVAVDNGDMAPAASIELTPEGSDVLIVGNVIFDPAHAGKTVDIVLVVSYKVGSFGPTYWFIFEEGVGFVFWDGDPANLGTYMPHEIVKDENLSILIFDGTLAEGVTPGTLSAYVGYRLPNGDVHFNGQPLSIYMQ